MAVLLWLVLLLWRPFLHYGWNGGGAGCQHLHREEQGAPLPFSHRHFQKYHARHAPPAQLPLPPPLSLLIPFDRPFPLPRPLACGGRWRKELRAAPLCTTFPGPHFSVHSTQPALSLPHSPGWRRHLPVHVVPWPQVGRVAAHVWNGGQGHALPAPQLLSKGWRRRGRGGDDERHSPITQVPQPFQFFQLQSTNSQLCGLWPSALHLIHSRQGARDGDSGQAEGRQGEQL